MTESCVQDMLQIQARAEANTHWVAFAQALMAASGKIQSSVVNMAAGLRACRDVDAHMLFFQKQNYYLTTLSLA